MFIIMNMMFIHQITVHQIMGPARTRSIRKYQLSFFQNANMSDRGHTKRGQCRGDSRAADPDNLMKIDEIVENWNFMDFLSFPS